METIDSVVSPIFSCSILVSTTFILVVNINRICIHSISLVSYILKYLFKS